MNICIIPSAELSYESGSTIYAHRLGKYLCERGHKIFVICSKCPKEKIKGIEYRIIDIMEHPVIDDYYISNERMLDSIYKITNEIIDINKNNPIDVIHAHYGTINSFAAMNIKMLLGIPYVVSCFGRDVFNGRNNDKRYARMIEFSLPYADYIICANSEIKDTLINCNILTTDEKCVIKKMPIDTMLFDEKSQTDRSQHDVFQVLSVVSCFAGEKGILITLKAIRELRNKGYNIQFSLIGCDEHPEKKNLNFYNDFIKENKMQDVVRFIGQLPNEEIAEYLKKTDLFVDSRIGGNFSSVILEALFSKVLVIASDVKGNTEFIMDEVNGCLYATGDYLALSEKIKKFILKKVNTDKYLEGIEKWIKDNEKEYSFNSHLDSLENIFLNVTKK